MTVNSFLLSTVVTPWKMKRRDMEERKVGREVERTITDPTDKS